MVRCCFDADTDEYIRTNDFKIHYFYSLSRCKLINNCTSLYNAIYVQEFNIITGNTYSTPQENNATHHFKNIYTQHEDKYTHEFRQNRRSKQTKEKYKYRNVFNCS